MTLFTSKRHWHKGKPEECNKDISPGESCSRQFYLTCLAALGIVYGDIGTSPLYALRECFYGRNPFPPTAENVLGILSLIFWSLLITISCKHLLFVMRADNRGEGGILAAHGAFDPREEFVVEKSKAIVLVGFVRCFPALR